MERTSSIGILGIGLGLAVAAAAPGSASATEYSCVTVQNGASAHYDTTTTCTEVFTEDAVWCLDVPTSTTYASGDVVDAADTIIVQGDSAVLLWTSDGDLELYGTDNMASWLWTSDTSESADQLCFYYGKLYVVDDAGNELWSFGTNVYGSLDSTSKYDFDISLSGCNVEISYLEYKKQTTYTTSFDIRMGASGGIGGGSTTTSERYQIDYIASSAGWRTAYEETDNTCPISSPSNTFSGWCVDKPSCSAGSTTIVESDWAELVYQCDGNLALYATGIDDGVHLWSVFVDHLPGQSPTVTDKVCFEAGGRLVLYDTATGADVAVWSTTNTGSANDSFLMSLDDCTVRIDSWDSNSNLYYDHNTCPQTWINTFTKYKDTSDVVIVENDDAELVFDTTGDLVLRSHDGDVYWYAGKSGSGNRVTLQSDGNLCIFDSSNVAVWCTMTSSANVLKVNGCSVELKGSGVTKFARGSSTCDQESIDLNWSSITRGGYTSISHSGFSRLLKGDQTYLEWKEDGNLCLFTLGGAQLWCSNTASTGVKLNFQGDGNVTIHNSAGQSIYYANTVATDGETLELGDDCSLITKDQAGSLETTIHTGCEVAKDSFESTEGNDVFGITMTNEVSASAESEGNEAENFLDIDVKVFGLTFGLFEAKGFVNEHGDVTVESALLDGNSVSTEFSFDKTFYTGRKTHMLGWVPVFVSASIAGNIGLTFEYSIADTKLSATPFTDVSIVVSAGVGVSAASAGVRGSVTLIRLSFPFELQIKPSSYELTGSVDISLLSGSVALYAEVKLGIWSAGWSKTLFQWKGPSYTDVLFSKSGSL